MVDVLRGGRFDPNEGPGDWERGDVDSLPSSLMTTCSGRTVESTGACESAVLDVCAWL